MALQNADEPAFFRNLRNRFGASDGGDCALAHTDRIHLFELFRTESFCSVYLI